MVIDSMEMTRLVLEVPAGSFLASVWKPFLFLLPFVPWAWVVSTVYDKHAARFFLPRRVWNLFHMVMGTVAFMGGIAVGMLLPSEGAAWVGFAFMLVVLVVNLAAYALMANRDERVPDKYRIRLKMERDLTKDAEKKAAKAAGKSKYRVFAADKSLVPVPAAETPELEARVAAENLVETMFEKRASQLDIGPTGQEGTYAITILVDGVREKVEVVPVKTAAQLMDFWRGAAKFDISDRRKKQIGMVGVEVGSDRTKIEVMSVGGQGGPRFTLTIEPEKAVRREPAELGLLEPQMATLREMISESRGVVLLVSPADGGRTTTMYTVTQMHDAYTSNVQTVEIEPKTTIEGVRTNEWKSDGEGGEFATTVRSILRRDPDVVAVSDMPDAETAQEVAKSDHGRTRVYLSFRAPDALTAVQLYVKAVGDPRVAGESLHGVIAQRLARRLCKNCRVAYPPPKEILSKLGIGEGRIQQLFKRGGQVLIKNKPATCPVCQGGGFLGQTGIFEVFLFTDEDRSEISAGNLPGLRASIRKKKLPTISQAAMQKAIDGETSIEEVMRVTGAGGGNKGKSGASSSGAAKKERDGEPATR